MLLPSELKLNVADYLDPQSSIDFGTTCKEHWQLCQPLFRRHTQAFAGAPVVTAHNVLNLLRAVMQDSSQGWYIREISFQERWDDPFTTPLDDAEQLQDAAKQLRSLYFRSSPEHDDDCLITQIERSLTTGHPNGALAVLLHHLPNLRTLRLTMARGDSLFENLLDRIGTEYVDEAKWSRLPLQNLRTVSLAHYDTEGCISVESALPFLRLPSLRTFAASMMGGGFGTSHSEPTFPFYPHPRSNIEEFCFVSSQFDAAALEYLLSCTPGLKRFTYDAGGSCTSEDPYDAKEVLKALAMHTHHSLECLMLIHAMYDEEEATTRDLYHGENERLAEADLSMFTKLHSLSANWAMLWPELSTQSATLHSEIGSRSENTGWSCKPLDIRDILPASLKILHLEGDFDREEWEGVVRPLSTRNEMTPNLTMDKIRIDGRVRGNTTYRNEEAIAAIEVGGWGANEQKMVFGGADKTWIKRAWRTTNLFEGHGW